MTQRAVLLEALASTPTDVARLVRGLNETAAAWRAAVGWSCRDVVTHLAAVEPLHLARWQRIVAEEEPSLAATEVNQTLVDTTLRPMLSELTERFWQSRRLSLMWLREIQPADWQRPTNHETKGRTTLRFLVQDLVAHDIEHTAQLVTILGEWRQQRRQDAGEPGEG
jgi:uncharacterized damage-inducible protein DinB